MAATTWIPAPTPAATAGPASARTPLRPVGPPAGPRRRARRLAVVAAVALAVLAGTAGWVRAEDAPPAAAGHVVLAPGETLWDLAVRTAGPRVDPREQLRDLVLLNGFDPAAPPAAWTVVLIPAR